MANLVWLSAIADTFSGHIRPSTLPSIGAKSPMPRTELLIYRFFELVRSQNLAAVFRSPSGPGDFLDHPALEEMLPPNPANRLYCQHSPPPT